MTIKVKAKETLIRKDLSSMKDYFCLHWCSILALLELMGSETGVLLEITAEEGSVREMKLVRYLLDALGGAAQLQLNLQNDIVIYDDLRGVLRHLNHDVVQVLATYVHLLRIETHIVRLEVVRLHQHHEPVEQLLHPVTPRKHWPAVGIAHQIVMIPQEERLQEQQYHRYGTSASLLIEICRCQTEGVLHHLRQPGLMPLTAVLTHGGVDGLLQLQAGLPEQGHGIREHLHLKIIRTAGKLHHIVGKHHYHPVCIKLISAEINEQLPLTLTAQNERSIVQHTALFLPFPKVRPSHPGLLFCSASSKSCWSVKVCCALAERAHRRPSRNTVFLILILLFSKICCKGTAKWGE